MNITHFHDFYKTFVISFFPRIFPGLEITIFKCHAFSRFSMTVRTLCFTLNLNKYIEICWCRRHGRYWRAETEKPFVNLFVTFIICTSSCHYKESDTVPCVCRRRDNKKQQVSQWLAEDFEWSRPNSANNTRNAGRFVTYCVFYNCVYKQSPYFFCCMRTNLIWYFLAVFPWAFNCISLSQKMRYALESSY